MPHECVSCGEVFDDGADEVFDGCPDCGATKFFYVKEVTEEETTEDTPSAKGETSPSLTPAESTAQTRARNQTHKPEVETEEDEKADPWSQEVDEVSTKTDTKTDTTTSQTHETDETTQKPETKTTDEDIVEAESEYEETFGGKLNDTEEPDEEKTEQPTPETDKLTSSGGRRYRRARPEEAKRRLMDQFETIRIVEPGSYELNLMNLYEEDEKIIALQEDGRYQVSLPSTIED